MYSPMQHMVSNIMPKTKQKQKQPKSKSNQLAKIQSLETRMARMMSVKNRPVKQKRKETPFASTGAIAGKSIGGMFGNASIGQSVGRWLGSGIGSIFGSGDYAGIPPAYNVLTNDSQIPQFSTLRQTNIVCHREYLGDITGTAGFNNVSYPLNPGLSQTFPWLSSVAENYQEYRFHGLVFEFRSLITDFVTAGAPGVVIMSTNYNADAPLFTTKQQMENAEYAVSVKPTVNLIHGVECALGQTILPEKFIRTGAVPAAQDLRLYDLGNFQFATQANPVQDLGELWVSYCIEFFKPILPGDVGGNTSATHFFKGAVTAAAPLGATLIQTSGQLGVTSTNTTLTWTANPQQRYLVTCAWAAASAAFTLPALTFTGCTGVNIFGNDLVSFTQAPANGETATKDMMQVLISATILNPGPISVIYGGTGVFGIGANVDIIVTEIDNTMTT